jgi:ribosome biogenesis GTPase
LTDGGFVVDTPGFSSLDIDSISKEDLEHFFPEFTDFSERCKYIGCSHVNEVECAVKSAVTDNKINSDRYRTYVDLYNEISKSRRRYK